MRISNKVLSFYISESDNKSSSGDSSTNPVDGPARLRSTLADTLAGRPQFFLKDEASTEKGRGLQRTKAKNGNAHPRQHNELNGGEKRGGHDRRKESHPALLDTRLTKRREDRAGPPTINFEA